MFPGAQGIVDRFKATEGENIVAYEKDSVAYWVMHRLAVPRRAVVSRKDAGLLIQMLLKRDSGTMELVATWRDAGILRQSEHTTFEYIDWDRITHYYRYLTCVIAKAGFNPD